MLLLSHPSKSFLRNSCRGALSVPLLISAVLVCSAASGQQQSHPLEAADTSSPRATLNSFIRAWDQLYRNITSSGEYEVEENDSVAQQIVRCLDLSEVPPSAQRMTQNQAAVCLKEVLDRIDLPREQDIPDVDAINRLATADDELLSWTIPHTEIVIARVSDGPRKGEYLFSPDTVERAPTFFRRVQHLAYERGATEGIYDWYLSNAGWMIPDGWIHELPNWTRRRYLEMPVWKWIGLVISLIVGLVVMIATYLLGRRLARNFRDTSVIGYLVTLAIPIAAMLVPLALKSFATEQLHIRGPVANFVGVTLDLVFLFAVLIVVVSAGNRVAEVIISHPRIHPRGLDAQLVRLLAQAVSIIGGIVVFLEGGQYLGIPLTTLLAGAGVGGLTLALAAQDTLKNVFGSMMIILDRPYRVGERVVAKDYDGVVEEIGLRSTKIRLLTGHLAAIPNEDMARSHIENIGRRPHIRRIIDIAIPLDTPPDKVQRALDIVRGILENHKGMEAEFPPRVFFTDFKRDALNLRAIYWYHPPQYWDFLAFSEKVNLQIMQDFENSGIQLALPSSSMVVTHGDSDASQPDVFDPSRSEHNS